LARQAKSDENARTALGILQNEDLARALVAADKAPVAESLWRQVAAKRQTTTWDDWLTFYARAMVGDTLVRQKKFAEAEPFVLSGYEGMKARETTIPLADKRRLAETGSLLIELYDAWGKKDKADEWRKRLSASRSPNSVTSSPSTFP
jgi:hypothetical protein